MADVKLDRLLIDALPVLLAAATPAPWLVYEQAVPDLDFAANELARLARGTPNFSGAVYMLTTEQALSPAVTGCGADSASNAALICALRNAAPEMLATIERLTAENAELRKELAAFRNAIDDEMEERMTETCRHCGKVEAEHYFHNGMNARLCKGLMTKHEPGPIYDALHAECGRMREALAKARANFGEYFTHYGVDHEDEGCPEDDTCVCRLVDRVNEAFRVIDAALRKGTT